MTGVARAAALAGALFVGAPLSAAQPSAYGPPPPPPLPDGYARDARNGELVVWRPASRGRASLLVADDEPRLDRLPQADLLQIARARNMTIAFLGSTDVERLRGEAAKLRGAGRLLGVAWGSQAAALLALSKGARLFDALMLIDAQPIDPGDAAPVIVEFYGSDAFWRAAAPPPAAATPRPGRRRYFLAGAVLSARAEAPCAGAANDLAADPALRALLVALEDRLNGGPALPASREAELAPKESLRWPKLPGADAPPPGDSAAPRIDSDGNETSGLRLPDQALPLATFTGWNAAKGCGVGQRFDFAPSRAAREAAGDPRPSLVERYGSRAYFVAALRSVADRLVKERLLLPQDADAYVAAGKKAPF